MKKTTILMTLLSMLFLVFVVNSFAVEVTLLGPNEYLRTKGAPNQFSDTFPGVAGEGKLIIYNGDEAGKHRISSATIMLNGEVVVGPKKFNKKVDYIEVPVSLLEENTLDIKLASKPGSFIVVKFIQDVDAEAAAVIGPEGGVVEVTDPDSELFKTKVQVPFNALTKELLISIQTSNITLIDSSDKFETFHVTPAIKILPEKISSNSDNFIISVFYKDDNSDGYIDDSTFSEEFISVYCLLEKDNGEIVRHENFSIDKNTNQLDIKTNHFSVWLPIIGRWMKNTIVYYYVDSVPEDEFGYYSEESFQSEIDTAFDLWQDALRNEVIFQRVTTLTSFVDILIRDRDLCSLSFAGGFWCDSDAVCSRPYQPGGTPGITFTISFNRNYWSSRTKRLWVTDEYCEFPPQIPEDIPAPPSPFVVWTNDPFLRLAMHEFGHSLGLPDYSDPTDPDSDYNICPGYTSCNDNACVSGEQIIMKYDQNTKPYIRLSPFDIVKAERLYDMEPISDFDSDGFDGDCECEDYDSDIYPGAEEICDGKDNDCDGEVDEECITPPPSDGLIANFTFDNDTFPEINDEINDNDGAAYGGVSLNGGVATFNGSNGYIRIPESNTNLDGFGAFTIALWVKPGETLSSATGRREILYKGSGSSGSYALNYSDPSGTLSFHVNAQNGGYSIISYPAAFTAGLWYHVAVTYDGVSDIRMYVDGQQRGSEIEAGISGNVANNSSPLEVGRRPDNRYYFNGSMDDLQIYDEELSQSEINDLIND